MEGMTNRKRAENASEMLTLGQLTSLVSSQTNSHLFRAVLGTDAIDKKDSITFKANKKERSFKDFISIVDESSLKKSLEIDANASIEADLNKLVKHYENSTDEEIRTDINNLSDWINGKKQLSISDLLNILLSNFEITGVATQYPALGKLLSRSLGTEIYWSLPCFMVDEGYMQVPGSK